MLSTEEIALQMYRAYGQTTGFKNYQGLPMPEWEALPVAIQQAWIAAAQKARELLTEAVLGP